MSSLLGVNMDSTRRSKVDPRNLEKRSPNLDDCARFTSHITTKERAEMLHTHRIQVLKASIECLQIKQKVLLDKDREDKRKANGLLMIQRSSRSKWMHNDFI